MIEFKFPCPSCGQRLQANDAYSGTQINCPTCQQPLIVPHLPSIPPVGSALAVPPLPPAQSEPGVPLKQRPVSAGNQSRTKWVVVWAATGLLVVGAIAFVVASGLLSRSESHVAGRPGKEAASHKDFHTSPAANPQSLTAAEIVQKVAEQYGSLTSYSATGTTVSVMDMSKADLTKMPGMDNMPAGAKESKGFQQAMSKPMRIESEFSAKLGRPGFYLVEWESMAGPAGMKGAVWSAGEGHFLSMTKTKYTRMESREMALASATGISGGVAGTLPAIFFQDQSSPLNFFKKAKRSEDKTVDGEDCYVLNGDAMGMKVILWVTKGTFLIKQKQMVLGGKLTMPEVSEATMEEGFKKMGDLTPEQKAQAKAAVNNMKPLLSQMKGTMTETYRNIEINKPVQKEDFNYELPAGAMLSKSLF
jgi:hypothetical protein